MLNEQGHNFYGKTPLFSGGVIFHNFIFTSCVFLHLYSFSDAYKLFLRFDINSYVWLSLCSS